MRRRVSARASRRRSPDAVALAAIQAKLAVNPVGDRFEREADRVADEVVGGGRVSAIRPLGSPAAQTRARDGWRDVGGRPPSPGAGFESSLRSESAAGRPLSDQARSFFEPRLGTGLQDVRIHDGARAASLSREINARAFTRGKHVFFAAGQHDTESTQGRHLMAHELTHTLQQRGGAGLSREAAGPIQRAPWEDAQNDDGQLEAFTDEAGARSRMTALRNANPSREYRIVERGENFVIQTREREAEAESEPAAASWQDVQIDGRLASFTDRPGAERRMGQLREENPELNYRIVERGGNFVIQSSSGGASAPAAPPRRARICGRDNTKVAGFPTRRISLIEIDLGNMSRGLSITWTDPNSETAALPSQFPISPGAGLCTTCCDGRAASRRGGSLCTPKGNDFQVDAYAGGTAGCALPSTSWATNATYFAANIRSGIAIHTGPRPGYPASHGCVRTTEQGSAIIYDNSKIGETDVHVGGTWSGPRCFDNIRQRSARLRRGTEVCGSRAEAETSGSGTMLAAAQPLEDPVDGAGPA